VTRFDPALVNASVLLAELTRDGVARIGQDGVVVVPIGATEQHGPHLPIGTDTLHVEHVARAAAAHVADRCAVAVAPTLPYGCSEHHLALGGTMSLQSRTLHSLLVDLGSSLAGAGCRRLFFVNGHGGNVDVMRVAARDISLAHDVHVGACTWWTLVEDHSPKAEVSVPGHAGAFETSVVAALRPELVRDVPGPRRLPDVEPFATARPHVSYERPGAMEAIDGYTDRPDLGRPDDGRAALALAIEALAAELLAFHDDATTP
jgi:creatinine amidohydrolase